MKALATVLALLPATILWSGDEQTSATERYRGRPIREVRLELEGAESPEASRDLVEMVEGERYRPEAIRRSIKQLFALGAFSDVKVEVEPRGDEVDVIFRLYPRLEIRAIELKGLKAIERLARLEPRLVRESELHPGDPLEIEALGSAAERIRDVLRREGFLWASVEPEASFLSPAAVVVFHVQPGSRARVRELAIEGVPPHIEAHVRRTIALTEGSYYARSELEDKIDALTSSWKELGFYGARVAVVDAPVARDRVDVTIRPELGPRVRIEARGWEFSDDTLRELVPLYEEARFTADLVEESRANLEGYLLEQGYRDARVSVEREVVAEGHHLIIRFVAEPGLRYDVVRIEMEGLHSVPEEDVRALLVTRTRGRVRSAPFRQDVWQNDLKQVQSYLERQGFHRVEVEGRQRISTDEPEELTLVVKIDEGPRAFVDSVEVQGATEVSSLSVLNAAGIEPEDPFDPSAVVEARERVVTLYRNEGFRQAEVEARTLLNEAGTGAAVTFRIFEGERTRVDRVILSGLDATRESAVRRLLAVRPGEPLSSLGILETRQRLVGSGLFRSVRIEVLPADPLTQRSDVLILLEEGPRTTFAYGFGYEERQLGRAELEITRRNLFGLNRSVSVFTRASFRGGRFITTYRQPDFFGFDLPLFVSAFAEEEDRKSFDFNRAGVGLQLSKRLGSDQNLLFRYRFDRTKVFQLEVDLEDIDRRFRNVFISALSVASVTDKRDDPLDPSRGQFRIVDLEWSSRLLGTRSPYLRGLAQQFVYFRLPHEMVAAVGLRLGIAQSFRDDRDALLPLPERFFAGGATTLRGFALDHASPKRKIVIDGEVVDGEPIGGNVLALLNLELRFPLFENLRGVVFSDNGNVYRRLQVMELLDWRYNVGFGFRYDTPLGPLRVDYGFKLDQRTTRSIECPDIHTPCKESFGRWHVSLGHAF